MRTLSPKVLRELRAHFGPFSVPGSPQRRWVEAIDRVLEPKRSAAPARKRRESKREAQRDDLAAIRIAVLRRADHHCEACGLYAATLEVDHFLSGSGRRRALQSVASCWALCSRPCHENKTLNRPSPAVWLTRFLVHVETLPGSDEVAAIVRGRLASLQLQGRTG